MDRQEQSIGWIFYESFILAEKIAEEIFYEAC